MENHAGSKTAWRTQLEGKPELECPRLGGIFAMAGDQKLGVLSKRRLPTCSVLRSCSVVSFLIFFLLYPAQPHPCSSSPIPSPATPCFRANEATRIGLTGTRGSGSPTTDWTEGEKTWQTLFLSPPHHHHSAYLTPREISKLTTVNARNTHYFTKPTKLPNENACDMSKEKNSLNDKRDQKKRERI